MTVSLGSEAIALIGVCGVEEVETLVGYLENHPDFSVDISATTAVHTAIWQALMVFRPKITGSPMSSFIADRLLPGLHAYFDEVREP